METPFEGLYGVIAVFVGIFLFGVIALVIGTNIKTKTEQQQPRSPFENPFGNEGDKNSQGQLTESQRRYQNQLKQEKYNNQTQSTISTDHGHQGEEETYPKIVGSLGEVDDEGCKELDGIRLIVTDLYYQDAENKKFDRQLIAKSMIIGEALNTPRFKKPFGRK